MSSLPFKIRSVMPSRERLGAWALTFFITLGTTLTARHLFGIGVSGLFWIPGVVALLGVSLWGCRTWSAAIIAALVITASSEMSPMVILGSVAITALQSSFALYAVNYFRFPALTQHRTILAPRYVAESPLDVPEVFPPATVALSITPVQTSLREIAARAIAHVRYVMEARNITLETTLPSADVIVLADPERTMQMLEDLFTYSATHTPRGGKIQFASDTRPGAARVSIRDDGDGVAPDMLPHVFDFDLAFAQQLIRLQGGTIEAVSAGIGRGTAFVVELPLVPSVAQPEAQTTQQSFAL